MEKQGYVCMLSNARRNVLYTGVTSNLESRIYQHKNKLVGGFSKRYNCCDLVWWEASDSIVSAIEREKQIKNGSRKKKNALVETINSDWVDLAPGLFG